MENLFGKNVKIYDNVIVRESYIGDNAVLADNSFVSASTLGEYCSIERRSMVFDSSLGAFSYTGYNTIVKCSKIGKYCSISWNVTIGGANHDIHHLSSHPFPLLKKYGFVNENKSFSSFSDPVIIENDVWIAANSVITRGVHIGNGAVIGASSVVTHDIPAYEIWAGVPAKKIGQRFPDDIISELQNIKWWEFPIPLIKENLDIFEKEITMTEIACLKEMKEKCGV